jgi:hypothetical protein
MQPLTRAGDKHPQIEALPGNCQACCGTLTHSGIKRQESMHNAAGSQIAMVLSTIRAMV